MSNRTKSVQLNPHDRLIVTEPVSFAAGEGYLHPKGTPGYDRLLAHARGLHGTKPGTAPNSDCEACQRREEQR